MKKIYYLSTCDTCRRILQDIPDHNTFDLQDIKTSPVSESQLDQLKQLTGSYESLFSKRAIKYKEMNLKSKVLSEQDYRKLILQEYTFLKRPIVVDGNAVFVGNEKKTVERLIHHMNSRAQEKEKQKEV